MGDPDLSWPITPESDNELIASAYLSTVCGFLSTLLGPEISLRKVVCTMAHTDSISSNMVP
jgi:hypothetical protein